MSDTPLPQHAQQTIHSRFLALQQWLLALRPLWQPQPFKQRRPAWCAQQPQLTQALLALDEEQHQALRGDDGRLFAWLTGYLPAFAQLAPLLELPERAALEAADDKHLDWAVPGRKWQQISAFASRLQPAALPLVEWCGGKGHLGRLLATRWGEEVTTLERDRELCSAGEQLARRAGVAQQFLRRDVLMAGLPPLHGQHGVALHACGELHRQLLRQAVEEGAPALDLSPCCYHLYGSQQYQPFSRDAGLSLTRDELRLAVTETVTSRPREVRLRDREMAWKLGYLELMQTLSGDRAYRAIRPIDKQWLQDGFAEFCRRLARREGELAVLSAQDGIDWSGYESLGWQRQAEVMRLSLLRHAVRRALELWLVLDMALYLQQHGYAVELSTFCAPPLTPRNLLLSARLDPAMSSRNEDA